MHKGSIAQLRSINVNIVPKLDTSQRCALLNWHNYSHSNTRGKPKQTHQIVVPEHHNKLHQNTCYGDDDDDDFIIAFQLCAQPQKNVHNQRVNTSYVQKCLFANIPY